MRVILYVEYHLCCNNGAMWVQTYSRVIDMPVPPVVGMSITAGKALLYVGVAVEKVWYNIDAAEYTAWLTPRRDWSTRRNEEDKIAADECAAEAGFEPTAGGWCIRHPISVPPWADDQLVKQYIGMGRL